MEPDPVVREMNVFVSQELQQQLYLLQYPMRPIERPLPSPTSARIKPVNKLLEVKHPITQSGRNFDPSVPEHLLLAEQTHAAAALQPATNYAIGVVRNNELHLTPLTGILQMRPSFRHVDLQAAIEDPDDDEVDKSVSEAPRQVMFKRKETERATEARQRSYAYKRDREEAERWLDLAVHDADSAAAREDFEGMFCEERSRPVKFVPGPAAYLRRLDHLHPTAEEPTPPGAGDRTSPLDVTAAEYAGAAAAGAGAAAAEHINPNAYLVPLAVTELSRWRGAQSLKAYVRASVVIEHAMLKDVSDVADDRAVAADLAEYALLVRGAWALRSEVLFPEDAAAVQARDTALALLHARGALRRAPLAALLGASVSPETLRGILAGVAELDRARNCWHLRTPDAFDLARAQPAAVVAAESVWAERTRLLAERWGRERLDACAYHARPPYQDEVARILKLSPPVLPPPPPAAAAAAGRGGRGGGKGRATAAAAAAAAVADNSSDEEMGEAAAAGGGAAGGGGDVDGGALLAHRNDSGGLGLVADAAAAVSAVAAVAAAAGGAAAVPGAGADVVEAVAGAPVPRVRPRARPRPRAR